MSKGVLTGLLIAVLIVAGIFIAPRIASGPRAALLESAEKATLAQRQLARHDPLAPLVQHYVNPEALRSADLSAVARSAEEDLARTAGEFSAAVRRYNERAREQGLPELTVPAPSADPSTIERALTRLEQARKDNEQLLEQAVAQAREGAQSDPRAITAAQSLGMAQYALAAGRLAQAAQLRRQQAAAQSRMVRLATEWKIAQGQADYYAGLTTAQIVPKLEADLAELRELKSQADQRVTDLGQVVEQRVGALSEITAELREAQNQMLELEERGFKAGDDASFAAYRDAYLSLSQRLQALQQREQELRDGTQAGAEITGDELEIGELRGGEPQLGLTHLRLQLAMAEETTRRLEEGLKTVQERLDTLRSAGDSAREYATAQAARIAELRTAQDAATAEAQRLDAEATAAESAALEAAQAAVRAFGDSQRTLDAYVAEAREQQGTLDPNGTNERLRQIVQDPYFGFYGMSAEAAARVLAGRIHAQRIEGVESLLRDLRVLGTLNPQLQHDTTERATAVETARSAARETLEQARTIYQERMARLPANTAWVPQAGAASVFAELARIDPAGAAGHWQKALDAMQQAVARRENSPYVRPHLPFRDFLVRISGAPAAATEPSRAEPRESPEGPK